MRPSPSHLSRRNGPCSEVLFTLKSGKLLNYRPDVPAKLGSDVSSEMTSVLVPLMTKSAFPLSLFPFSLPPPRSPSLLSLQVLGRGSRTPPRRPPHPQDHHGTLRIVRIRTQRPDLSSQCQVKGQRGEALKEA